MTKLQVHIIYSIVKITKTYTIQRLTASNQSLAETSNMTIYNVYSSGYNRDLVTSKFALFQEVFVIFISFSKCSHAARQCNKTQPRNTDHNHFLMHPE